MTTADQERSERPRVLFLCTHNSARSQMAESFLRHYGRGRFEACSAGLEPTQVHPLARQVLEDVGIDSLELHAKAVNAFLAKVSVNVAIVVCATAHESCPRLFPFAKRTLYWPFDDPAAATGTAAEKLAAFRRVRDEIETRVRRFLAEGV
jgi:arsenate reductase